MAETDATQADSPHESEQPLPPHDESRPIHADKETLDNLLKNLTLEPRTEDLLKRCNALLQELAEFEQFLAANRRQIKEFSHFRNEIRNDFKAVARLAKRDEAPDRIAQTVISSNTPFFEAVWAIAKQNRDIRSLKRHQRAIDVVADGGLKWIKVSTMTESRLLHEMAEKGWEWAAPSDDDSEAEEGSGRDRESLSDPGGDDDSAGDISLVKMAQELTMHAKATRERYRHPKVHFILTRLEEGKVKDIDTILSRMRATGATVECSNPAAIPIPLTPTVLEQMSPSPFAAFSSTINIDCTILLALVSDISHQDVSEAEWFNRAIRRQIEIETNERLLPEILWPAMVGREMLCTEEAMQRMREITEMIGTEGEKARMRIMLGDDQPKSRAELIADFQQHSQHQVPDDWWLPIKVVQFDDESIAQLMSEILLPPPLNSPSLSTLPLVASKIHPHLTPINRSVFFFGWAANITTITSNRTCAKGIDTLIELNRTDDEETGPRVWVCATSRSLFWSHFDWKHGARYDAPIPQPPGVERVDYAVSTFYGSLLRPPRFSKEESERERLLRLPPWEIKWSWVRLKNGYVMRRYAEAFGGRNITT